MVLTLDHGHCLLDPKKKNAATPIGDRGILFRMLLTLVTGANGHFPTDHCYLDDCKRNADNLRGNLERRRCGILVGTGPCFHSLTCCIRLRHFSSNAIVVDCSFGLAERRKLQFSIQQYNLAGVPPGTSCYYRSDRRDGSDHHFFGSGRLVCNHDLDRNPLEPEHCCSRTRGFRRT